MSLAFASFYNSPEDSDVDIEIRVAPESHGRQTEDVTMPGQKMEGEGSGRDDN